MKLSLQQEKALHAVSEWLKNRSSPVFRLFGYAGTGKTTLARYFAETHDGFVQFAAFTGKAAQVLRSKGATNARTVHSLIYRPNEEQEIEDKETGKMVMVPSFSLNRRSAISDAKLIIIDECSMIDETLGRDLMSFGIPILVLGDPAQLPPVAGGGFFTDALPDFMLTEIHRQARDNPIIRLALDIREGAALAYGDYGQAKIISKKQVTQQLILDADQILIGTNRTRKLYNRRLRELKGFESIYPQSQEKLVCLRNNPAKSLLNGSLWKVVTSMPEKVKAGIHLLVASEEDDQNKIKVKLLKSYFETIETEIPWSLKKNYDDFDYGYALTVHKAQGSQWDNVVLFDESFAFREIKARWLYTAITRAASRLTIIH